MNPFDLPPSEPAVSISPSPFDPDPAGRSGGRGRVALVALAAAGLIGVGIVGISELASADRAAVGDSASAAPGPEPDDDGSEPIDPVTSDDGDETEDAEPDGESDGDDRRGDGEIVIDDGDGDPLVIDLGDATIDGAPLADIAECVGVPFLHDGPMFDLDPGELRERFEDLPLGDLRIEDFGDGALGDLSVFGSDGTHITVVGPDGVSVIDLGEGNGSATITQRDGEVTIATDGEATVERLPDVIGDLGALGDRFEDVDPQELFDEFFADGFVDELPDFEEMFDVEPRDPAEIEACLDELRDE